MSNDNRNDELALNEETITDLDAGDEAADVKGGKPRSTQGCSDVTVCCNGIMTVYH